MPTPAYNDNAIPYGSRALHIFRLSVDNGSYVFENISVNRPTNVIKRHNEVNEPNGSVGQNGFVEGTATVQLAIAATVLPLPGDTFTVTLDATVGSEVFIIHAVGQPEAQADYFKASLSFIKKYGA